MLEIPKGEITENFGRIQRGGEFTWKMNEWGEGGIAKVIKSY